MNPEALRNQHGKIWRNVGGGTYFLKDFVNVDSCFLYFLAPFYPAIKPLLKAGPGTDRVRDTGFRILDKDDSPSASFRRDDPCQVNMLVEKPAV